MKVADAFTGKVLQVGDSVPTPDGGTLRLLSVRPGILNATARVEIVAPPGEHGGGVQEIPLQVRWTHPRFFLQHVGFINS